MTLKDLKPKIERKAKNMEEDVSKLSIEILNIKDLLMKEINKLKEPLALEILAMK